MIRVDLSRKSLFYPGNDEKKAIFAISWPADQHGRFSSNLLPDVQQKCEELYGESNFEFHPNKFDLRWGHLDFKEEWMAVDFKLRFL